MRGYEINNEVQLDMISKENTKYIISCIGMLMHITISICQLLKNSHLWFISDRFIEIERSKF